MVQEMMAQYFLHEQERRFSAPAVAHKQEWAAGRRVEKLQAELNVERARLSDTGLDMKDVWRKMPV